MSRNPLLTLHSQDTQRIIISGWMDDVMNAVGDAASSTVDALGSATSSTGDAFADAYDAAVQYAKDHPDQIKAIAAAAATAAGTAVAGPAGGAIAGNLAGQIATAAVSGGNVQQAAQQAVQQAAQNALNDATGAHAAILDIAHRAFVGSALAHHALGLTQQAAQGDVNAQHAIVQTAQAAANGNQAAQLQTLVVSHAAPAANNYASALALMSAWG